jgi:hypothetical protein
MHALWAIEAAGAFAIAVDNIQAEGMELDGWIGDRDGTEPEVRD